MLRVVKFIKTSEEKYKRVYHRRKNKEIVQILGMKDATFSYKEKGKRYLFYIVDCEVGDCIKYSIDQQYDIGYLCYEEQSSIVYEMYREIFKRNKPIPKETDKLLQELLPFAFTWLDSTGIPIWSDYKFVLEKLEKNVDDYIAQMAIDVFIEKLCEIHEIAYLKSIIESKSVTVSVELYELFEKSKKELSDTIDMVKGLISNKTYNVISNDGINYVVTETIYGTPCGKATVVINLNEGFNAQLRVNNKIGIHTEYTITDELEDLKYKFYKK